MNRWLLGLPLLCSIPLAHAGIHAMVGHDGKLHVAEQPLPGSRPFNPLAPQRAAPAATPVAARPHRARQLHSLIAQAGREAGIDIDLLHAVVHVESQYDPYAVSKAGAAGLMQLMPATAKRFGVHDRFDPAQNLRGGAAYLAWLWRHFDGDLELVLAAYNAGEGAVRRYRNRIPPYAETQSYVRKVMALYAGSVPSTARRRRRSAAGLTAAGCRDLRPAQCL